MGVGVMLKMQTQTRQWAGSRHSGLWSRKNCGGLLRVAESGRCLSLITISQAASSSHQTRMAIIHRSIPTLKFILSPYCF